MLTRRQAQILINPVNNLSVNQQIQITDPVVDYVFSPFRGNINPVNIQGLKIYIKPTKEIYKEYNKLYISVPNAKDIIDNFLSIANKFVWGRLFFW